MYLANRGGAAVAAPRPISSHNDALQSLRGLAAVSVMFAHSALTLSDNGVAYFLAAKLFPGDPAVMIFFVLSGYVLAASLTKRGVSRGSVIGFYVRRIFRIYPALCIGVSAALVFYLFLFPLPSPHRAAPIVSHYSSGLSFSKIIGSYLGIDAFLLFPTWTVCVELFASIALPAIVILMRRNAVTGWSTLAGLLLISLVSGDAARQVPAFLFHFGMGAMIAVRPEVARFNPGRLGIAFGLLVLVLFHLVRFESHFLQNVPLAVQGLGAAVVIAGLIQVDVAWMRRRALVALGDWSFGIYLLHVPVAFTLSTLFDAAGLIGLPLWLWSLLMVVLTTLLTVPLSALTFQYVERPGIEAGKRALQMVQRRRS